MIDLEPLKKYLPQKSCSHKMHEVDQLMTFILYELPAVVTSIHPHLYPIRDRQDQ